MEEGRFDGLVLAAAGLARLGVEPDHVLPLPMDEMVPAPGQGALAVQARDGAAAAATVGAIDHRRSRAAFEAERLLVGRLGGGCRLPLGAYAEAREDGLRLLAVVVRPDGSDLLWSQVEAATPEEAAGEAAETLLGAGAEAILAEVRE
jgi:hydroxymethylbilane synthase